MLRNSLSPSHRPQPPPSPSPPSPPLSRPPFIFLSFLFFLRCLSHAMLFTMYPLRNAFSSCTYAPRASCNHKVVSYTSLRVHLLPQESRRLRLPRLFAALSPIFLFHLLPALPRLSRYLRSRDTRVRKSTRPWPHATLRRGTRKSREPYSERDRHRVRVTASIIRGEPRFSRDIGVDEALSVPFTTFLVSSSRGSGAVYGFIIRARLEKAARFHGDDAKVSATSG